jgi:hypothetical protein
MPEVYSAHHKKSAAKKKAKTIDNHKVFPKLKAEANANPLASFAVCPPLTRFTTQESGENVILLLRQHPVVNIPWLLLSIALIFFPAVFDYVPLISIMPANFQFMTLVLWYFMVLVYVVGQFLHWYFNVYIVTDERVVDIDFFGMAHRDVKVTKLDKIQDVNFQQGGLWASIFNYGHVYIQTAGEGPNARYDFLKVPRPARVIEILGQLIDEEEAEALEGKVK